MPLLLRGEGAYLKLLAAAADTRATAAPLIYPRQPRPPVALRSWESGLGEKIGGFFWEWLGDWLGNLWLPLKSQTQPELLQVKARFTQWWMP